MESVLSDKVRCIRTYSTALTTVAVSPDGEHLLTGGTDARLFSIQSGRELRRFAGRAGERIVSVGFTPDNKYAYAGFATGSLGIYRLDAPGRVIATGRRKTATGTWEPYAIEEGAAESCFPAAAASTVGNSVWLGTGMGGHGVGFHHEHRLQKWSWESRDIEQSWGVAGELPHSTAAEEDSDLPAIHRAITTASPSPNGEWIVAAAVVYEYWSAFNRLGQRDAYLYQLNTSTGGSRRLKRQNFAYNDIAWSNGGSKLLLAGTSSACEIREAGSWRLVRRFDCRAGEVRCARFLPGDQRIVTAGTDGTLRLWSTKTGEQLAFHLWEYGAFSALALSAEGCAVYGVGDSPVIAEWQLPI